jgi:hypothetical protein
MANIVTNPTADQSIQSDNLLPASANTAQSLGTSAARWNATLGSVVVENLNTVLYADQFPGSTADAQIAAALAALPSTGGIVDARGLTGAQSCSANPFASYTGSGVLLLGAATFTCSAQWTIPNRFQVYGIGRPATTQQNTVLVAGSNFPTGTAVISLGNSPGPNFGVRVENLGVDGNNIVGVIGFQNLYSQEESGWSHVLAYNCAGGNFLVSTSAAQNSGPYRDMEALNDSNCTNSSSSTIAFQVNGATAFRGIDGLTVNYDGATSPNNAIVTTAAGTYNNIHTESVTVGMQLSGGDFIVSNFQAGPNITTAIDIASGSFNVALFGVLSTTGNLIVDNVNGNTIVASTEGGSIGMYVLGNGTAGSGLLLSSSINFPSRFPTEVVVNGAIVGVNLDITNSAALPGTTAAALIVSARITSYNGTTTAGNGVPAEVFQVLDTGLTANFNSGSAMSLFTPTAAGMWRISFSQQITTAATSSSTFPSLTLSYTDAGGVARAVALVSASTTNTTAVLTSGTTEIFTNGSTAVTITSASYASSGATAMHYALAITAERL